MNQLNVGVIGCGSISDMHLSSYANNQYCKIYAVCDINKERAKEKAEKYKACKYYEDYSKLLTDEQVEAVSICTWNNSHAKIAIKVLEAGKHVLVEKPMTLDLDEAIKLEHAVSNSDKNLQVGFVRRYASQTRFLKDFIDAGELGDIYYAKASCIRRLGNPGGWFADKSRSGGGPLIDIGVHVIDLCWYLMGCPKVKSVSGNTYHRLGNRANIRGLSFYKATDYDPNQNTVEDLANALIRFENGASLLVDASYTLHAVEDEISAIIYGTNGGAEIEPQLALATEKHNRILNSTPQLDRLTFDFNEGFQNEIDHFVSVCRGERETLSPVEDGLEMMKILCGIYESAEKQIEIHFE